MLQTAFQNKLQLIDATQHKSIEQALGECIAILQQREQFANIVEVIAKDKSIHLYLYCVVIFALTDRRNSHKRGVAVRAKFMAITPSEYTLKRKIWK